MEEIKRNLLIELVQTYVDDFYANKKLSNKSPNVRAVIIARMEEQKAFLRYIIPEFGVMSFAEVNAAIMVYRLRFSS